MACDHAGHDDAEGDVQRRYTDRVIDYFIDPPNWGELEGADARGEYGDIPCGDYVVMQIKVAEGRLADVRYQVFGCPVAIAACAITTEMAMGKRLGEALAISESGVCEALGGVSEMKAHCSLLAVGALHAAIRNYRGDARGKPDPRTS